MRVEIASEDEGEEVPCDDWCKGQVAPVLREMSCDAERSKLIRELMGRSSLRMPNQSRHTLGKSENTHPCASPSIELAIQRLWISSTLAAMSCEMKKSNEVSTSA